MQFKRPIPAFFSYAREDQERLNAFVRHLEEFRLNGVIDDWDDREIRAGQRWEEVLLERARKSRVFFLLISIDFINSPYCRGTELHLARALYERRAAAIAPVLLRACRWRIEGLKDLQVIMPFGGPVASWPNPDEAWTYVADEIEKTIKRLDDGTYFPQPEKRRDVPALLPFSIGRDAEVQSFRTALAAAAGNNRPFVCILSGDCQGQSEFIDILAAGDGPIRQTFRLNSANYVLTIEDTKWIRSREPAESLLNDVLAIQVEPGPASEKREDIAAAVAEYDGLTLVRFALTAEEWRVCGGVRLNRFLQYWNGWPALKPDRPVLVFLTIRAEIEKLAAPGPFWLPLKSIDPETEQDES